jgi:hypothetical protein
MAPGFHHTAGHDVVESPDDVEMICWSFMVSCITIMGLIINQGMRNAKRSRHSHFTNVQPSAIR